MLKKIIKYVDYDGNERTEEFHFNLSKTEVIEMEVSVGGGITKMLEKVVREDDKQKIVGFFKEFILKAYGEKSPDGRRFVKSQELSESFSQTEAYVELFLELSGNAEAAAAFINGVIPQVK